jgi:N-methylhydantoinase A
LAGFNKIIGIDMGGTSTDVFLVDADAGGPGISNESIVSGIPIGVPMLDIHTAGAGGGSIARFDSGGMLRVGPESAGAYPGPICFGRGEWPTVTDANLVLGRLDTDSFLGGSIRLDRDRAVHWMQKTKGGIATVEDFAAGILRLVETSMEKAIRIISVERGYDPRDFTLVAFGGGGPLHACSLAHALRVPRVMVPALPGGLSAVGILLADTMREYSRTVMSPLDANLEDDFLDFETLGFAGFDAEGLKGLSFRSVDMRYRGQGYELNVPYGSEMASVFHSLHKRRYGFSNEARAVEIVNIRVRMVAEVEPFDPPNQTLEEGDGTHALLGTRRCYFEGNIEEFRHYGRDLLRAGDTFMGPAIISEYSSATFLPPGDVLRVDALSNLIIEVH